MSYKPAYQMIGIVKEARRKHTENRGRYIVKRERCLNMGSDSTAKIYDMFAKNSEAVMTALNEIIAEMEEETK